MKHFYKGKIFQPSAELFVRSRWKFLPRVGNIADATSLPGGHLLGWTTQLAPRKMQEGYNKYVSESGC